MRLLILALVILNLSAATVQAANPLVNMNVTNAEVRDVLTALAAVGGTSIVADDTVTGKITIQLRNIPFETALDLVTKTKGLTYTKLGNVIVVGDANQLGRGFGSLYVFKLQYAKPADVAEIVMAMMFGEKAGSRKEVQQDEDKNTTKLPQQQQTSQQKTQVTTTATGLDRLKIDDATNSLIFFGSQQEAEQIKKILAEIDIPYQQVSLEAQVLAVNKSATKDLGIDWTWSELPKYPEYDPGNVSVTTTQNTDGTITSTNSGTKPTVTRDKEDMVGTIRFGRSPNGLPYEFYYSAKISALITDGKANMLAKPKITTINGKRGHILIGDKIPVRKEITENNRTTASFEYQEAGVILDFVPRINDNGEITIDLKTSVSTPTLVSSINAYQISTREAETEVRLKDGETMVIGGLIGSTESGGKNKVPFFSDLPLLGKLFESVHRSKNDTEVVIFLTARIVK